MSSIGTAGLSGAGGRESGRGVAKIASEIFFFSAGVTLSDTRVRNEYSGVRNCKRFPCLEDGLRDFDRSERNCVEIG